MTRLILPARDVLQATPRTRIIRPDLGRQDFPFFAGDAVLVGLADGAVRRPYSIACSPAQARRMRALELLVQIDDHAVPDPHLERAVPGTPLSVEGPFGSFRLPAPLPERHLLLVAGGTGIAPLRAILWETLERDANVGVTLIYSARRAAEFAYADELRALAREGRIALALRVTREAAPDDAEARYARIDEPLIASVIRTPETRCVVCGPPPLVAHARALLRASGVAPERILTETYGG